MKHRHAFALGLLLTLASCSGQFAYDGPLAYEPFLSVKDRYVMDSVDLNHPKWIHNKFGVVTNPSDAPLRVSVTCDLTLVWDLLLPPRTSQMFLLTKGDSSCDLAYAVHTATPTHS
jgi:hypothetical protein